MVEGGDAGQRGVGSNVSRSAKADLDSAPVRMGADAKGPKEVPPAPIPDHELGKNDSAFTDNNQEIEFQWAVVSAKELKPDRPDLQPRKVDTVGRESTIQDIQRNVKYARLSSAPLISDGAPMVGNDFAVLGVRLVFVTDSTIFKLFWPGFMLGFAASDQYSQLTPPLQQSQLLA